MTKGNRLSLNIRAQSVTDRNGLRRYLKAADMSAVLVLDDLTLAADIKQDLPNAVVIHRAFGDSEAHLKTNPVALAERYYYEGYGRYGVHAYGPNEPAPTGNTGWGAIVNWLVAHGTALAGRSVQAVMGNVGPGNIERADIDAGQWDPYLKMLSDTGHLRGDHDYTCLPPITGGGWGHSPFDVLDPAKVQPNRWPDAAAITDSTDNWHLMRGRWLNARAKAKGWRVPGIVLTECFFDRMPDLEQIRLASGQRDLYKEVEAKWGASGYALVKGHNTWRDAFRAYWPTWTFEEALFQILKWCDDVYPPEYVGFCQFMYCPDSPDWDKRYGYDFSRLPTLQRLIVEHGGGSVTDPTPPTPDAFVSRPADAGAGIRATLSAGYNVRAGNGTLFAVRGSVPANGQVVYYPDTERDDVDPAKAPRKWVWVEAVSPERAFGDAERPARSGEVEALAGWMASEGQFVVPLPEPPQDPEPPEEEPPIEPEPVPPQDPGLVFFGFTATEAQQMVLLTREKADKVETTSLIVSDIYEMQRQVAQLQQLIAEKEEGLALALQDHAHIERQMADIIEKAWQRGQPATNITPLTTTPIDNAA